ncbi:MAG: CHASE2 domain-containing protein, partial [Myxococcota bacterium]
MRKYLKLNGLTLSLLIIMIFIIFKFVMEMGWAKLEFLDMVEMKAMDEKFVARGKVDPGDHVVIVAADEKSMAMFGQWPWPRRTFAELLDRFEVYGSKVVGFDAFFPERDTFDQTCDKIFASIERSEGAEKSKSLRMAMDPVYGCGMNDRRFGESLKINTNAVEGYFFFNKAEEIKNLDKAEYMAGESTVRPSALKIVQTGPNVPIQIMKMVGVQPNIPEISEGSERMGYVNQIPDKDGLYRSIPLVVRFGDNYYPSLALSMLRTAKDSPIKLEIGTKKLMEEAKTIKLSVGDSDIPVNETTSFLINYYGPGQTFKYYSAVDVWSGEVGEKELKNRIVLFGATTIGIYDIRPTPFDSLCPGVEIHANVIQNILSNDYITRPEALVGGEFGIMLVLGILFGLALTYLKLQYGVFAVLVVMAGYSFADFHLFFLNGMYSKTILTYVMAFTLLIGVSVFRYFTEEREKGKIRKVFSTYMSKNVVEMVLKDTHKLQLGGVKKNLTVFFSDIRGFTTISEKLTPEKLVHLLNSYLSPMTNIIIEDYNGT